MILFGRECLVCHNFLHYQTLSVYEILGNRLITIIIGHFIIFPKILQDFRCESWFYVLPTFRGCGNRSRRCYLKNLFFRTLTQFLNENWNFGVFLFTGHVSLDFIQKNKHIILNIKSCLEYTKFF